MSAAMAVHTTAGMAGYCRDCGDRILPDEPICGFVPYRGHLCARCCPHELWITDPPSDT